MAGPPDVVAGGRGVDVAGVAAASPTLPPELLLRVGLFLTQPSWPEESGGGALRSCCRQLRCLACLACYQLRDGAAGGGGAMATGMAVRTFCRLCREPLRGVARREHVHHGRARVTYVLDRLDDEGLAAEAITYCYSAGTDRATCGLCQPGEDTPCLDWYYDVVPGDGCS